MTKDMTKDGDNPRKDSRVDGGLVIVYGVRAAPGSLELHRHPWGRRSVQLENVRVDASRRHSSCRIGPSSSGSALRG